VASTGISGFSSDFNAFSGAFSFATGGHVSGPGTGTSDSIPARLSNGEFVVNAAATAQNRPLLEAMNGGRGTPGQTHFASGGLVNTGGGTGQGGTNIAFNISQTGNNGQLDTSASAQSRTRALQKELETSVIEIVRKHSLPGGQINNIIKSVNTP
jgi:hypothetical protein